MWALSNGGARGPGADPQRARGILLLTADDQSTTDRAELSRRSALARLGVAGTAAMLGLVAGAPGPSPPRAEASAETHPALCFHEKYRARGRAPVTATPTSRQSAVQGPERLFLP